MFCTYFLEHSAGITWDISAY